MKLHVDFSELEAAVALMRDGVSKRPSAGQSPDLSDFRLTLLDGGMDIAARMVLDAMEANTYCAPGVLLRDRVVVSEVPSACLVALLSPPVASVDLWWYAYLEREPSEKWTVAVLLASRLVDSVSPGALLQTFAAASEARPTRSDLHQVHRAEFADDAAAVTNVMEWIRRFQRRPSGERARSGSETPVELQRLRGNPPRREGD